MTVFIEKTMIDKQTVKTTIMLDRELYTKLVAAAAMKGVTQSQLVSDILKEALSGIVVFDRHNIVTRKYKNNSSK